MRKKSSLRFHHHEQGWIKVDVDESTKTLTIKNGHLNNKQELLDLIHETHLLVFMNQVHLHMHGSSGCVDPDVMDAVNALELDTLEPCEYKLLEFYHRFDDYKILQAL